MIKCGVCSIAFKTETIDNVINIANDCSAEVVELWSRPQHVVYPIDRNKIKEIKKVADDNNIGIPVLGSYLNGIREVFNNNIKVTIETEIEIAKLIDATIIRLWAGVKDLVACSEDEIKLVVESLRKYSEKAESAGLTVVIERHNNTLTKGWWDIPLSVLRLVNNSNCKLNYQPPYPYKPEEYKNLITQDFENLLPISAHCHLQNYKETNNNNLTLCSISEGVIDYSEFGKIAKTSGYVGAFMIEFLPKVVGAKTEVKEILKNEIGYIKKIRNGK